MIKFDYRGVDSNIVGFNDGINIQQEFENYKERIAQIINDLYTKKDYSGECLQWMNLCYSEETIWYIKEYASMVENRFDNILILGVGGSSLGGICLTEALLKPYWNYLSKEQRNNYPRIFFLDNVDPDCVTDLLSLLDLKRTLVNVITKSGSTAEVMALYMVIKDLLEKELGDDYRKNIVATTDKQTGVLRQLADQEGYKTFVIPDDVGGRFSVFSAVGLLPLALTGIDIDELIQGIKDMDEELKSTDIYNNIAAQNALIHYLLDTTKGKKISVMMPYSSRLKYLPDWYAHLWAESLGKEYNNNGEQLFLGQTPLKAVGAKDQYSQLQLFNYGPNDKIYNFINIEKFDKTLEIPNIFEYTHIGYLGGKTMNSLMEAELDSTRVSLSNHSRPIVTITLPELNSYNLAQLLYMFEVQTAIASRLYNINLSNRDGVEQVKNYTYALMGRSGYEESASEIQEKLLSVSNVN